MVLFVYYNLYSFHMSSVGEMGWDVVSGAHGQQHENDETHNFAPSSKLSANLLGQTQFGYFPVSGWNIIRNGM